MAITASIIPSFTSRIGGGIAAASNFVRPVVPAVGSMISNITPNSQRRRSNFINNFMGFGSDKNEKKIKKSMKLLRNTLVDTFEIAKVLRVAVQKIAEQLKDLAADRGGGGLFGGGLLGNIAKIILGGVVIDWLGRTFMPQMWSGIKTYLSNAFADFRDWFLKEYGGTLLKLAPLAALMTLGGKGAMGKMVPWLAAGFAIDQATNAQGVPTPAAGLSQGLIDKFDNVIGSFSRAITRFKTNLIPQVVIIQDKHGTRSGEEYTGPLKDIPEYRRGDSRPEVGSVVRIGKQAYLVAPQVNVKEDGTGPLNLQAISDKDALTIFNSNVVNTTKAKNITMIESGVNPLLTKQIMNLQSGKKAEVNILPYDVGVQAVANNPQLGKIINPSGSPGNGPDFAFYVAHNTDISNIESRMMYNIVEV